MYEQRGTISFHRSTHLRNLRRPRQFFQINTANVKPYTSRMFMTSHSSIKARNDFSVSRMSLRSRVTSTRPREKEERVRQSTPGQDERHSRRRFKLPLESQDTENITARSLALPRWAGVYKQRQARPGRAGWVLEPRLSLD